MVTAKSDGCAHMHCPELAGCGTKWCWWCGQVDMKRKNSMTTPEALNKGCARWSKHGVCFGRQKRLQVTFGTWVQLRQDNEVLRKGTKGRVFRLRTVQDDVCASLILADGVNTVTEFIPIRKMQTFHVYERQQVVMKGKQGTIIQTFNPVTPEKFDPTKNNGTVVRVMWDDECKQIVPLNSLSLVDDSSSEENKSTQDRVFQVDVAIGREWAGAGVYTYAGPTDADEKVQGHYFERQNLESKVPYRLKLTLDGNGDPHTCCIIKQDSPDSKRVLEGKFEYKRAKWVKLPSKRNRELGLKLIEVEL